METNYTLKNLIRGGTVLFFFLAFVFTGQPSVQAQDRNVTDLVLIIEGVEGSAIEVIWATGSGTIVGPVSASTLSGIPVGAKVTFVVDPVDDPPCLDFLGWEDVNIGVPILKTAPYTYEITLLESLIDALPPGEKPKVKAVFGDYSTYEFVHNIIDPLCPNTGVDVEVTFKTADLKQCGYDGVRFEIKSDGPGNITFTAEDELGSHHTFVNNGYWGPALGFDLPADYDVTTEWVLSFSEIGDYEITFSLIYAPDGDVVKNYTKTIPVTVNPEPILYFTFDGVPIVQGGSLSACFDSPAVFAVADNVGEFPYTIEYTINGASQTGNIPDNNWQFSLTNLLGDDFTASTYNVEITSITDGNGCEVNNPELYYNFAIEIFAEPVVGFSFNGDLADTDDEFNYCYNQPVTVTLSQIWSGTAPFNIEWEVNGVADSKANVELGGELFGDLLVAGTYDIQITSIVDANGCTPSDHTPYTATVIVHPEPEVIFSYDGTPANPGDSFDYCYDETITVTVDLPVGGFPLTVIYTLDDNPSQTVIINNDGDVLFTKTLAPGEYEITFESIVDDNDCSPADYDIYTTTLVVHPEPAIGFSFNGVLADTGDVFEYCYNEPVTVTLSHIWYGTAPFDIEWTVNGVPYSETGVELDGLLYGAVYDVGTNVIQITSIEDANGCSPADYADYTATVVVNPEPAVGFSFNGVLADTNDVFNYCYNEPVTVTLSHIWYGTAPFDIEWTVNGVQYSESGVELDGLLYGAVYGVGTNVIQITSIEDANGCSPADYADYTATVVVHPEPAVGFSFNGVLADTNDTFEYCYDEDVTVTLSHIWSGTAPFDIEWSVNGDSFSETGVVLDGELFNSVYGDGTHVVQITSIVDANGCSPSDYTPYTATIIVHPEPEVTFSYDGTPANPGDSFDYCYNETITVTVGLPVGEFPLTVIYAIDDNPSQTVIINNDGDVLFTKTLAPGEYEITFESIVDDNDCSPADYDKYTTTLVVHPEPAIGFSFNGVLADTGDVFEYCYNEPVTVTLSHIWYGTAPFDIEWSVNGNPYSAMGVELDDALFGAVYDVGTNVIEITSIVDAIGCSPADYADYTATVVVHPEPAIGFSFDGELADTNDTFEYCFDEPVTVTLSHIWSGTAPFDIAWTVNGDSYSATDLDLDDKLFEAVYGVGTHVVQITSIVDANGCSPDDYSPYTAKVVVHPEPAIGFSFDGELAGTGDTFEYCYDEDVTVTLSHIWSGTAPFYIAWTVNGDSYSATDVDLDDKLFEAVYGVGTHVVQITSIVDANGCSPSDYTPYTATIIVHPEPAIGFSFDGNLAGTDDTFGYCFDEDVTVTLSHIWSGTAPFDIEWEVNGVAVAETGVDLGDVLFNGNLAAGTYDVEITSIIDANGCSPSDYTPYKATVIIHPEPIAQIINLPDDVLCSNGVITLDLNYIAEHFGNIYTITWYVNDVGVFTGTTDSKFEFNAEDHVTDVTVSQDVTVKAHIVNEWGCEHETGTETIHVTGRPYITHNQILEPEHTVYCSPIPSGIIIFGDGEVEWEEMPTHEDCEPKYQWYRSTDLGNTWSKVGGEGTLAFYQLPAINTTTFYKREVTLEGCDCPMFYNDLVFSNIVEMHVIAPFGVAEINEDPDPVCISTSITLNARPVPASAAQWVTGVWTADPSVGVDFSDVNDADAVVTASVAGSYELTWTYHIDGTVHPGSCGISTFESTTATFDEIHSIDDLAPLPDVCFEGLSVALVIPDYDVTGEVVSEVFSGTGVIFDGTDYSFDPSGLAAGDYDITFTLTTVGGCVETKDVSITIYQELAAGAVTGDQTICYGETPDEISASAPSGGSSNFEYQWQVLVGTTWVDIDNETGLTYQPEALNETTSYKLVQTDVYCDPVQVVFTDVIVITVYDELVAGTASGDQTICFGQTPGAITATPPTGGSDNFTYQWQAYNVDTSDWDDIPGAVELIYVPEALFETTTFRLAQADTHCDPEQVVNTNEVVITVYDQLIAGTASADQTICYGQTPDAIEATVPTGGSGNYEYQWQILDGTLWVNIDGATGLTYQPDALFETTQYQLLQTDNNCLDHVATNAVTISVDPLPVVSNEVTAPGYSETMISGSTYSHTQCSGIEITTSVPTLETVLSDACGELRLQTEYISTLPNIPSAILDASFAEAVAVGPVTISPTNVTGVDQTITFITIPYYDVDGSGDLSPGDIVGEPTTFVLTVHSVLTASISADQTICFGTQSDLLTSSVDGGSGNYTYQWQVLEGIVWVNIDGAVDDTYQPTGLTETSEFRLLVDDDSNCGPVESNEVTITVNELPMISFGFNGVEAGHNAEFEYMYDTPVEVTLHTIYAGTAPFEVTYTINGGSEITVPGLDVGGVIAPEQLYDPGVYNIVVTSIKDDNGCEADQAFLDLCTAKITIIKLAEIENMYQTAKTAFVTWETETDHTYKIRVPGVVNEFQDAVNEFYFDGLEPGTAYTIELQTFINGDLKGTTTQVLTTGVMGDTNGDGNFTSPLNVDLMVAFINGTLVAQGGQVIMTADELPDVPANIMPFIFDAADFNNDGKINIFDIVLWVINVQGKNAPDDLKSMDAGIYLAPDVIRLDSDGTLAGLEFELTGQSLDEVSLKAIPAGFQVTWRVEGNTLYGMLFSLDNQPIEEGIVDLIRIENGYDLKWGELFAANLIADYVAINTFDVPTDIEEVFTSNMSLEVYPNPSKGKFTTAIDVPLNSSVQLILYDMQGRQMARKLLDASGSESVSWNEDLNPGMYLLRMVATPQGRAEHTVTKEVRVLIN